MDLSVLYADLGRLERDLSLPSGFLERLSEEDDWSFVIKSHAIIEAALTHFLISSVDNRLASLLHRLPFGGGSVSKIAVARSLGLMDDSSRDFVRRLSELRNRLVHDVGHLSFSFESWVGNLSSDERHSLGASIAKAVAASEWQNLSGLAVEGVATATKATIFFAVIGILARMLFRFDPKEYERAVAEAKDRSTPMVFFVLTVILVAMALGRSSGERQGPRS